MAWYDWEVPFTDFKPFGGSVSRDKKTGETTSHDYNTGFNQDGGADKVQAEVEQSEADANNYGKEQVELLNKMYEEGRVDRQPFLDTATQATRALNNKQVMGMFDPNEFQFDKSQYEMPGEFSFSADEFRDDPFYQFLQDEGARAYEASKAARGGLASAGTLFGLQERGQNIAGKYYNDEYNRQSDTYGTNMNRAIGERAFGYGQSVDDYNRDAGAKMDDYNRLSNMAGGGQVAQNAAASGMDYAGQVGGVQGNLANMNLASAMNNRQMEAQSNQAFWNNLFNAGGLGLGIASL